MPILRILPNTLLIFTFIYLMMCPVVLKLSNGHIDKNVIHKIEYKSFEEHSKKQGRTVPPGLTVGARINIASLSKTSRHPPFPFTPILPPAAATLSTVRLLL